MCAGGPPSAPPRPPHLSRVHPGARGVAPQPLLRGPHGAQCSGRPDDDSSPNVLGALKTFYKCCLSYFRRKRTLGYCRRKVSTNIAWVIIEEKKL